MLRTADRYYRSSARLTDRAVLESRKARNRGPRAVALVVAQYQATQANEAPAAVSAMLTEQRLPVPQEAPLNPLAFTTSADVLGQMLEQADVDWRFNQLIASLVQDAGRAAQLVSITARPNVQHVRHLNPPSCSRCAVLAGRVYRFSDGFKRHPGCDCVMVPVTVASRDLTYDPVEMTRNGQVTGLSKADMKALDDGADFNRVVNVRSRKAGLTESGETLTRVGRLTPAGIYRQAGSRDGALSLLERNGYLI